MNRPKAANLEPRIGLGLVSGDELVCDVVQVIADNLRLRANPEHVIADPPDQRRFPAGRDGAKRVPCMTGNETELERFDAKFFFDVAIGLRRWLVMRCV